MVRTFSFCFFFCLFFFGLIFYYALVCKKSATELHEEGNIVYIEYYMKLVHNSDEEKKSLQSFKPYYCYSLLFPLDENISIK